MDPLTGAVIAGGAQFLGSAIQNQQNRANADHAFNQSMEASNTAHQREVTDLRKAGLNPILSALGSGASTPNATPSQSVDSLGQGISKGAETALAIRAQNKEMDLKDQTIDNMRDSSFGIKAETQKTHQELKNVQANTDLVRMQTKVAREMLPHALKKAKAEGDWSQVNQLMGVINAATSSAADVLPVPKLKLGK